MIPPDSFTGPRRPAGSVAEDNTGILGGVDNFLGDNIDGAIIFLSLGAAYRDLITYAEWNAVFLPVVLRSRLTFICMGVTVITCTRLRMIQF